MMQHSDGTQHAGARRDEVQVAVPFASVFVKLTKQEYIELIMLAR
jgi:hypothetical protein